MKEISLGVELYNERIVFKMTKLQKNKKIANSCMTSIAVEETPPGSFGISGDIFNYMPPICLKYAHKVNSDMDDASEESSREDSDEEDRSLNLGVITKDL
jgi:hypothetical protein